MNLSSQFCTLLYISETLMHSVAFRCQNTFLAIQYLLFLLSNTCTYKPPTHRGKKIKQIIRTSDQEEIKNIFYRKLKLMN